MAFEYDKAILNSGNPELLPDAINRIVSLINKDMQSHPVAGVYGISLGSFIGFNILRGCDIQKGLFNTGGVSVTNTIWMNRHLASERARFISKGHDRASLLKHWSPYEVDERPRKLKNKIILLFASTADTVLPYKEAAKNVAAWQQAKVNASLVPSNRMEHGVVIVRTLLRVLKTRKFFRDK